MAFRFITSEHSAFSGFAKGGAAIGVKGLFSRVARRGSVVATAYLSTSVITLAVLFVFARRGDATLLREVLAAQFIATLAAGLEPATTKALALSGPNPGAIGASRRTILSAGGLKALAAAPILAFVWRLSDPAAGWPLLICTPLVCIAGFAATDLRVLFDLQGRHAEAIWIKQGSLGGGLVILAVLAAGGMPMPLALGLASLARIVFALFVARAPSGGSHCRDGVQLGSIMRDPRWMSLAGASVLAAIGGTSDRVFGLRYLSADGWAGYYALYEVFSKFWFISYLVTPIVFARTAAGLDSGPVSRVAWRLTASAGALFVVGVSAILLVAPGLPERLLGPRLDAGFPPLAIVAFAAAVAIGGLAQIRIAELQGRGAAHRSLVVVAASAAVSTALFYAAARSFGAAGLLYAWLAKSAVDLTLTYVPPWPRRRLSTS
jgi:hypothetical protein